MEMNVAQVIDFYGTDKNHKDRTFIMYRDRENRMQRITFAAFRHASLRFARLIHRTRQEKGKPDEDRFHVAFFMQNTPEVAFLLGGCAFANATLVGINNAQRGAKLAADINNMDLEMIFVDEVQQPGNDRTFLETLLDARRDYGLSQSVAGHIIARKAQRSNHPDPIPTIEDKLAQTDGLDFSPIPLNDDNTGVIIFTSGTTGAPKGIEVLWKKVFDVGVVSTNLLKYTAHDVGYICMPLNHSNSLYLNFMPALINGAKVLLRRRFSSSNFISDITESGATVFNSVGDPVKYILSTVGDDADYAHLPLRVVISTGTNAANRAAFTRIFGLEIFAEAYGSTEVGALALVTPDTPHYSVGRVMAGKDVRVFGESSGRQCAPAVVDEAGNILNFSEAVGELAISQASLGDSAFSGYYNMPKESAQRLDGAGFFRMGDLGAIEEKNGARYVIFLGRTGSDRLRNKGENFAATFVEEILAKHPAVKDCAVIGIPYTDSTENDNPVFVLETPEPEAFDAKKFYRYCRDSLPAYALPGYLRLLPRLPRTDTHKMKKSVLAMEFIERTPERDGDPQDVIYRVASDGVTEFTTTHFKDMLEEITDPAVRARFRAITKRQDIF